MPCSTAFANYNAAITTALSAFVTALASLDPTDIVAIDKAIQTYTANRKFFLQSLRDENSTARGEQDIHMDRSLYGSYPISYNETKNDEEI